MPEVTPLISETRVIELSVSALSEAVFESPTLRPFVTKAVQAAIRQAIREAGEEAARMCASIAPANQQLAQGQSVGINAFAREQMGQYHFSPYADCAAAIRARLQGK